MQLDAIVSDDDFQTQIKDEFESKTKRVILK